VFGHRKGYPISTSYPGSSPDILDWDSILILDYLVIGFSLELQASDFRFPDARNRIQSLESDSWIFRISGFVLDFNLIFGLGPLASDSESDLDLDSDSRTRTLGLLDIYFGFFRFEWGFSILNFALIFYIYI